MASERSAGGNGEKAGSLRRPAFVIVGHCQVPALDVSNLGWEGPLTSELALLSVVDEPLAPPEAQGEADGEYQHQDCSDSFPTPRGCCGYHLLRRLQCRRRCPALAARFRPA